MESEADLTLCPHCGGKTALAPDARARWVCAACGGPRIPGQRGDQPTLQRARHAQMAGIGWGASAMVLAAMAAVGAILGAILWTASHAAGIVVGLVAGTLLILGLRASANARARRGEAKRALDEAWRMAAVDALRARGQAATAAELAATMRIDVSDADALLTALGALDQVRVDVGDEGAVKYRVDTGTPDEVEDAEPGAAAAPGERGRA